MLGILFYFIIYVCVKKGVRNRRGVKEWMDDGKVCCSSMHTQLFYFYFYLFISKLKKKQNKGINEH